MTNKEVTWEMKQIRMENLINNVKRISDLNFQQKAWVENSLSDIWDTWEERMCMFFDDVGVDSLLQEEAKEYGFSKTQLKELTRLRDKFDEYSTKKHALAKDPTKYFDPQEIVNDPEWHRVIEQAKITLKAFEGYQVPKD